MTTDKPEGIEQFQESGDCLVFLLLQRGMSAAELAGKVVVSPRLIWVWVAGEREPDLDSDYVDRIAKALADQPLLNDAQPRMDDKTLKCELVKRQQLAWVRFTLRQLS